MNDTLCIVIGCIIALFAILASRQGEARLHNETKIKILEAELALKKEENKQLEIMKEVISEDRKAR
jgi:hypothetical protein